MPSNGRYSANCDWLARYPRTSCGARQAGIRTSNFSLTWRSGWEIFPECTAHDNPDLRWDRRGGKDIGDGGERARRCDRREKIAGSDDRSRATSVDGAWDG